MLDLQLIRQMTDRLAKVTGEAGLSKHRTDFADQCKRHKLSVTVYFTHTTVHACGVGQHQSVDTLIGGDEDDDIVEGLLDVDSSRQQSAVGELEFDGIIEQVCVQRLLHQLHRVS